MRGFVFSLDTVCILKKMFDSFFRILVLKEVKHILNWKIISKSSIIHLSIHIGFGRIIFNSNPLNGHYLTVTQLKIFFFFSRPSWEKNRIEICFFLSNSMWFFLQINYYSSVMQSTQQFEIWICVITDSWNFKEQNWFIGEFEDFTRK